MTIIGPKTGTVPETVLPTWSAPHVCDQWREITGSATERTAAYTRTVLIEQCQVCGAEQTRPSVDSAAAEQAAEPMRAAVAALLSALWPVGGKPPVWQNRGTCAGMEPKAFDRANNLAAAVCGACPVRVQCLTEQLRWEAKTGRTGTSTTATVRGGWTATDRVTHHITTTSREHDTTISREYTTVELAA